MRATSTTLLVGMVAAMLAVSRSGQALRPITVNVDVAVGPSQTLVARLNIPLPDPTTATFKWNLTSEPPGLTYESTGLHDDPAHQPRCPEGLAPGTSPPPCHCYPTEPTPFPASGTQTWVFDETYFLCHTHFQELKIHAASPASSYRVRGTLTVSFAIQAPPIAMITVTRPAAGAVVAAGPPFEVAWTKKGQMAATVRIELIPSVEPQAKLVLVSSTPNDGSASCSVPTGYPGTVKIRVVTTDNRVSGESKSFQIPPPGHGPL